MSKVIQNALYVGSTTLGVILVLTNSTLGADFSRSTVGKNESATAMGQSTPYSEKNDWYISSTLTQSLLFPSCRISKTLTGAFKR
jgi:hypothetical protein